MQFYVSGEYNDVVLSHIVAQRWPLLSSFAYRSYSERAAYIARRLRGTGERIPHILDSGAFTVWSKGAEVDIEALCDTCNRLQDGYEDVCDWTFISLDVIPGKVGGKITPADIASACQGSARNYDIMRQRVRGTVVPVFHVGDPVWLAELYLAHGAQYVALGMSFSISEAQRTEHAARNAKLFEGKRLHGLAATGSRMLRAAPWHSVDSAAWVYTAAMGGISLVVRGRLQNIAVSSNSPKLKLWNGHFRTLPAVHRREVLRRVEEAGYTIEGLEAEYEKRWLWNITQYREACAAAAANYQQMHTVGLFDA